MVHFTYQRAVALELDAAEVLRDIGKLPHLLLRIAIRGSRFPQRALHPFARILEGDDAEKNRANEAHWVEIDDDEGGLRAYFATDLPLRGTLQVGYGSEVSAEIPLARLDLAVRSLDEQQIKIKFHRVTLRDSGAFKL